MSLFAYITPECQAQLHSLNSEEPAEAFRRKVEHDQNCQVFDRFLPTPFMKKAFGRSFRLIAIELEVGGDQVVCFLRFWPRGSHEYLEFNERIYDDKKYALSLVNEAQLRPDAERYVEERRAALKRDVALPAPNHVEAAWLSPATGGLAGLEDVEILETDVWLERIATSPFSDSLLSLHSLLVGIQERGPDVETAWDPTVSVGFVCRRLTAARAIVLLSPIERNDPTAIAQTLASFPEEPDELRRRCVRAYPQLILAHRDSWVAIEKDSEANLALSPEELRVLDSVRAASQSDARVFPLFINGRAGSGKSTMLQFLMRDYIAIACDSAEDGEALIPLYMTASRELLDRARGTVSKLMHLSAESLIASTGANGSEARIVRVERICRKSFRLFHEFLLELVADSDRGRRFQPQHRVTYPVFRRLWDSEFTKRQQARTLSPDVSWHAIRTYIKGMAFGLDAHMDPHDYETLSKRQRTITNEMFARIYKEVWEGWYQPACEQRGLWDDQDLALAVLGLDQFPGIYPAILCDEAQDFTRIELEVVFRLSLFSRRTVAPLLLKRIPFIFAGDPFQTLNPTGFRWSAVQASFHEKVVQPLDGLGRSKLQFNYQELLFNYRSSDKIVAFCNLLQLLRFALFQVTELEPQKSWRGSTDSPLPSMLLANDPAVVTLTKQQDVIFIVNCHEGEETSFAQKDSFLSALLVKDEHGVPRNVLSPARAKGLEFNRVVLYRFGETAPKGLPELMEDPSEYEPDTDLPYEYFLNRLYVAASRARRRLFVVDSQDALESFWAFATDPEVTDSWFASLGNGRAERWRGHLCYLQPAQAVSIEGDQEEPGVLALQYETRGDAEGDPYLLRQARLIYESLGQQSLAKRCLARALWLEGRHSESGNLFAEMGLYDDAVNVLWAGRCYSQLTALAAEHPQVGGQLRIRAAAFAGADKTDKTSILSLVQQCKQTLVSGEHEQFGRDQTWQEVWNKIIRALALLDQHALSSGEWTESARLLTAVAKSAPKDRAKDFGEICYRAGDLDEARRLFEFASEAPETIQSYLWTRARQEPRPNNLRWLAKLKSDGYSELLAEWEENGRLAEGLSVEVQRAVVEAMAANARWPDAADYVERLRSMDLATHLVAAMSAGKEKEHEYVLRIHRAALVAADAGGRWSDFLDVAHLRRLERDASWKSWSDFPEAKRRVSAVALEVLARSEALARDEPQNVADWLRTLLQRKGGWSGWRGLTSLQVAGAAVERAGRIVDALALYEAAEKSEAPDIRAWARRRHIKCREKRALLLEREGRPGDAVRAEREARELREAAKDVDPFETLPDYPELPPLAAEPAAPVEDIWKIGTVTVTVARERRLAKFDNSAEFDNAKLDVASAKLQGGNDFTEIIIDDEIKRWTSKSWQTTLELKTAAGLSRLVVTVQDQSRTFEFRV